MSSAAVQPSTPTPITVSSNRSQYQYYAQSQSQSQSRKSSTRPSNGESELPTSPISPISNNLAFQSSLNSQYNASPNATPQLPVPPRSSSYRTPEPMHLPSRQEPQSPTMVPPLQIQREESLVLDRHIMSDPAEDQERINARAAATPTSAVATSNTPTAPLTSPISPTAEAKPAVAGSKSGKRPAVRFGDYFLGQTLGEGEFGKVKMGWKKDSATAQVAIKLIRKEIASAPSRAAKIHREISILQGLNHPYIVQLHEKVETERHIGIILEYASGGELFDYILHHRYLKDNVARKLFAQLISGVGYLHKKGIVHRDLKLENLLLDKNRNIIITDFGFANTFDPADELGNDIEMQLADKEFVKHLGLDSVDKAGHRRGDLMQTSCGSPCYAAPELVVSDSLYTGRKVDVWSCGVILYAMLAGYLPFDDDPANPEGDNINLLYKYIVSTPLIFPEYVTPHARDLLKQILVPNPRSRASLFEVARHSWLSEYANIVEFITSNALSPTDIARTSISLSPNITPSLARSASVREPSTKSHNSRPTVVGGLTQKNGHIDQLENDKAKARHKRNTLQVEYVTPETSNTKTVKKVLSTQPEETDAPTLESVYGPRPVSPSHTSRNQRSASENIQPNPYYSSQRPSTGGYGQAAVGIARDQAHGRFSQPRSSKYIPDRDEDEDARHDDEAEKKSTNQHSAFLLLGDELSSQKAAVPGSKRAQSHKRSSTLSGLTEKWSLVKRGSLFGGSKTTTPENDEPVVEKQPIKRNKKFPPTSMTRPIANDNAAAATATTGPDKRPSSDSSRRLSFSFGKKSRNDSEPIANITTPEQTSKRSSRRFSLLPFSRSSTTSWLNKSDTPKSATDNRPRMAFGRGESRSSSRSTTDSSPIPVLYDSAIDGRMAIRKPVTAPMSINQSTYVTANANDNAKVESQAHARSQSFAPNTTAPAAPGPPSTPRAVSSGTAFAPGPSSDSGYDDEEQHNRPAIRPGSSSAYGQQNLNGGNNNGWLNSSRGNQNANNNNNTNASPPDSRPSTRGAAGILKKKPINQYYEQGRANGNHGGGSGGSGGGAAKRMLAFFSSTKKIMKAR